jgi:hypothetical protein
MEKSYHVNAFEMVSKKGVLLSVLTLFIVFAALASMTTVVHAPVGEIPAGYLWVAPDLSGVPYDGYDPGEWVKVEDEFDVLPCHWYYITVVDIPQELGDPTGGSKPILINVENDGLGWRPGYVLSDGSQYWVEVFPWHCPEADYCTKYRVLYKGVPEQGPDTVVTNLDLQQVYVAMGTLQSIARLHVIPEFAFGTVMAMLSSLSGLAIFSKFRRR